MTERSRRAFLLAGMQQLKGIRINIHKGMCPLHTGEEDVKHILLDCLETRNWKMELLN